MKVHPVPRGKITPRYDVAQPHPNGCRQKKLRRLPHIFAKVLELPFHSHAEVSIEETPTSLRFTAAIDEFRGEVWADAVEIYPGITKVVVQGDSVVEFPGSEFELDLWRFRLPDSSRLELSSAAYEDGDLVVTVPKGAASENDGDGAWGAGGRFVIVQ